MTDLSRAAKTARFVTSFAGWSRDLIDGCCDGGDGRVVEGSDMTVGGLLDDTGQVL